MSSSQSNRLWVGPLLLILVVALIYIFSLMPNSPPHRELPPLIDDVNHMQKFQLRENEFTKSIEEDIKVDESPNTLSSCLNGGFLNETNGVCICLHHYTGVHCEKPVCSRFGQYSEEEGRCICEGDYVGEHCESRCHGWINQTTGECLCSGRLFGKACDLVCVEGHVVDGRCRCREGYMGLSCATCDPSSGENVKFRQNDEVLRHRAGPVPPSDDTWYRVFQPAHTRAARCRHDLMCGGSWIPRDRALLVAPGRAAVVHGSNRSSSRGRRQATPPPNYASVDNLLDDQLPPSYEEATRILGNSSATLIRELIDETVQTVEAKEESSEIARVNTDTISATTPTPTTEENECADTTTITTTTLEGSI
ncbi:EGF-like domain protein [Dictyocaulus viviparus]|uniref:EGF-like domain protein n=1 Tax=Dictyocaulus viviparus TaxID=29172 RepID=A0A0D8XSH2_DICVI|nr:EGF-like domain protein [Dictyocaulus viviparus]